MNKKSRKFKRIAGFCAVAAATLLAASQSAKAYEGSVTLNLGPYQNDAGGEFTAVTSGLGTFQTFCLEYNEEFNPGTTYYYNVNSGATSGDLNLGHGSPIVPNFDPLSIGTAWLYSQFRAGTLANYASSGSARQVDAGLLQNAIWYLEDELGHPQNTVTTFDTSNIYYQEAVAAVNALGYSDVFANANGAFNVVAMNISAADGTPAQDQLAIVPEASTVIAAVLLLLPLGASAVRVLAKNKPLSRSGGQRLVSAGPETLNA